MNGLKNKKGGGRYGNTVVYAVLAVLALLWIFPFAYLLLQSFRGEPGVTT
jgi:ABC-type glycerol-3-phosphate transport system permease component